MFFSGPDIEGVETFILEKFCAFSGLLSSKDLTNDGSWVPSTRPLALSKSLCWKSSLPFLVPYKRVPGRSCGGRS